MSICIQRLNAEELHKATFRPVEFVSDFTEDQFDRKWELTCDSLRKNLGCRWREAEFIEGEQADFALSDDRNNAWIQIDILGFSFL